MSVESIIVGEVVKGIVSLFKDAIKGNNQNPQAIEANVKAHLSEIIKWSERIQFFGMSSAESTDDCTIGLTLETVPRKFRGINSSQKVKTEVSILEDRERLL